MKIIRWVRYVFRVARALERIANALEALVEIYAKETGHSFTHRIVSPEPDADPDDESVVSYSSDADTSREQLRQAQRKAAGYARDDDGLV